ncbi:MAG: EGF domain-containing protein [Myxococcota bacterium]
MIRGALGWSWLPCLACVSLVASCSVDNKYGSGGKGGIGGIGGIGGVAGKAGAPGGGASSGGRGGSGGVSSGAGAGGQVSVEAGAGGEAPGAMGGSGGEAGAASGCGGLVCAAEAKCVGSGVDARCECPAGYSDPQGDGTLCQDIDECTKQNGGCDALVTCTNTVGARVCGNCPFGYTGSGESGCTDINECTTNNGGCDKTVTCVNTPGGHTCGDCPAGYTGGGASGCVDINECATNNGGCDPRVTCSNAAGTFSCGACPSGYTGSGSTGCVDVNECATNNGGCHVNATCTNTAGSRTCACKAGFAGDGLTCTAPGTGCRWNCSGSNCVQVALDQDGDGHGSAACAAAPGDDCDDSQDTVLPGATELCDGIDNDCDKKIDFSDGLPLVGAIQNVSQPRQNVSIAAHTNGSFGLVGTAPSTAGLYYGYISASGVGTFPTGTIFSPPPDMGWFDTHLAWGSGPGKWGVVYTTDGRGGRTNNAGVMAFTGCCWEGVTAPAGGKGDITTRGQGDLLMAGASVGNLNLATYGSSGTPLTGSLAITGTWDSYNPRLAASGTSAGVIWQTLTPRALNWSLVSSTLTFGAVEQLSTTASYADISAIGAGYGLAWIEGVGFRFMIKKANGSTQCTSSVVPFGTVPSNQRVAVGDSAIGTVVVATSPDSNAIHLYRFDSACKVMDDIDVNTAANAPTEPRVVRGGSHVVVYWREGTSSGRYRFLSDLLCH